MKKIRMQEIGHILYPYLPNCSFGEENDGQIVIYTDMRESEDGYLVPFELEDE